MIPIDHKVNKISASLVNMDGSPIKKVDWKSTVKQSFQHYILHALSMIPCFFKDLLHTLCSLLGLVASMITGVMWRWTLKPLVDAITVTRGIISVAQAVLGDGDSSQKMPDSGFLAWVNYSDGFAEHNDEQDRTQGYFARIKKRTPAKQLLSGNESKGNIAAIAVEGDVDTIVADTHTFIKMAAEVLSGDFDGDIDADSDGMTGTSTEDATALEDAIREADALLDSTSHDADSDGRVGASEEDEAHFFEGDERHSSVTSTSEVTPQLTDFSTPDKVHLQRVVNDVMSLNLGIRRRKGSGGSNELPHDDGHQHDTGHKKEKSHV